MSRLFRNSPQDDDSPPERCAYCGRETDPEEREVCDDCREWLEEEEEEHR